MQWVGRVMPVLMGGGLSYGLSYGLTYGITNGLTYRFTYGLGFVKVMGISMSGGIN